MGPCAPHILFHSHDHQVGGVQKFLTSLRTLIKNDPPLCVCVCKGPGGIFLTTVKVELTLTAVKVKVNDEQRADQENVRCLYRGVYD